MFFQPHIERVELPCDRLPAAFDGLKLLHLSDLHITQWTKKLDIWKRVLSGIEADVVAITGDLGHRSWLWKRSLVAVERLLEPLTPKLGTYFILGNHDAAKLGPALAETKDAEGKSRVMLKNESVFLEAEEKGIVVRLPEREHREAGRVNGNAGGGAGGRLAIIGVHQHRRIDTDIPTAMREVRANDFKLMMLHYPDLVHPAMAAGADICLAGHTHGGQICWPDGRPLFRQDTLSAAQCTGLHRIHSTWMVVNRGIGVAGLRVRMFCPPEAILLTLRSTHPQVVHAKKGQG